MTIFGALRVQNETRWMRDVIQSIAPLCERIFVFDDNSTDGTPDLCEQLGEAVTVIRSTFRGLDEARDKQFLLNRVMGCVSDIHLSGDPKSPFWCLAIDGDEVLHENGAQAIRSALVDTDLHAFKLPIWYLWESDLSLLRTPLHRRVRIDRVYRRFAEVGRPSIFRLFNRHFEYQRTPFGKPRKDPVTGEFVQANFHCSNIPQELLACAQGTINAPLWHLGYNYRADRLRKYMWYNEIDPDNEYEDCYRHCIQGDVAELPEETSLLHAGPMRFEMR